MSSKKRITGLLAGILVFFLIRSLPLTSIAPEGRNCLALTLMTVVMWAMQVAQPGFISGLFLAALCLLKVAEPAVVFSAWSGSTMWLVIGAYLIATAVNRSGLGERLSYIFILRFVKGYRSIVISIFALTLILSLLIPNPWPRAFLIMAVMRVVIRAAQLSEKDAVQVGFCVFAAQVPVSLIFFTGDASINPLAAAYVDGGMSFAGWLTVMGVPALLLSLLTMVLFFLLFRVQGTVTINRGEVSAALDALGKMSVREMRTLLWVIIAVILWMTNGITGLDIGWVTLVIAMCMSLPLVGEVLEPGDWKEIPVHVLVFLTAAIAIGRVGGVTGMNAWIAETLLPKSMPDHVVAVALVISAMSVVIHMIMGSVIAVMGIAIPAFLAMGDALHLPQVMVVGIVYLSVAGHYLLPFHHLNLLVGMGEENGKYTQKETLRMGIPLTAVIFVTVVLSVFWWKLIGLW